MRAAGPARAACGHHTPRAWFHPNVALDACSADRHFRAMSSAMPLAVVIVSGIVYHLAQKAAGGARPWPMLAVAYGAAFALALVLAVASSDAAVTRGSRERAAGLMLGLAAFGIE